MLYGTGEYDSHLMAIAEYVDDPSRNVAKLQQEVDRLKATVEGIREHCGDVLRNRRRSPRPVSGHDVATEVLGIIDQWERD